MKKLLLLTMAVVLVGCVGPLARLGLKTIKYDDIERPPTPKNTELNIYSSRSDIPYEFKVIGLVQAAPMAVEKTIGYKHIPLLKKQARKIGGKALLNIESNDNGYIWRAEVIVPTSK